MSLVRQRQNKAARRRCCAVLLHQLERLAHAHEAQVCAGDSSCEDDGARQPISGSVYRSACPIGLKRRGVHLNYEEFVLRNTVVTNRQCYYTIYNVIYDYSNSSCPFYINYNNNGTTVLETMGCSTWSFQIPCLPGDALCGLPVNPSDVDGNTAISLAAPFKLVLMIKKKKTARKTIKNRRILREALRLSLTMSSSN